MKGGADLPRIENTVRLFVAQRRLAESLRLLHDVLKSTPLADRYWVIGGLLIGWAREGRILPHDAHDADFAFLREDLESFLAAAPRLIAAGFQPLSRYVDNRGLPVEYAFQKDRARFDFFVHERVGGAYRCTFFENDVRQNIHRQMISQVPAYTLGPMEFLGRTWQKPADHEAFLTSIYGDWRVPNPFHNYRTDDLSIVEVSPWSGATDWPQ